MPIFQLVELMNNFRIVIETALVTVFDKTTAEVRSLRFNAGTGDLMVTSALRIVPPHQSISHSTCAYIAKDVLAKYHASIEHVEIENAHTDTAGNISVIVAFSINVKDKYQKALDQAIKEGVTEWQPTPQSLAS